MSSKPPAPGSFGLSASIPVKPRPAPAVADPLLRAGMDAHRAGRLDDAEAHYTAVLRTAPNHVGALTLSGALALARGNPEAAIQLTQRAIKVAPGHLDAYLHLSDALARAGRGSEAIAACGEALRRAPNLVPAHLRLAKLLGEARDPGGALEHARAAVAAAPQSVEALCAMGLALQRTNKPAEAETTYRQALQRAPGDLRVLAHYAAFLNEVDRTREAADYYRLALRQLPDNPLLLRDLASILERDDEVASALELYDRALRAAPKSADLHHRRGLCLSHLGDREGATAAFRRALSVAPDHGASYLELAKLKRLEDGPAVRDQLVRLMAAPARGSRNPIEAGFALGELLDQAGEPDAAFERFAEANRLLRGEREAIGQTFDRNRMTAFVDEVDRGRAAEYVHQTEGWANPSPLPVFVVGMPRSGTTLVEQICASHSRVVGAGELRAIQAIDKAVGALSWKQDNPRLWDAGVARAAADKYVAELARIGAGAERVIDKTPLNIMNLGLIGALFPNAKVIWCRRDPRDVVVSNHLMYFAKGNLYSTDQSDCAFLTREIDRLGEIWKRELTLPIHELVYEDLVSDPETTARAVIDFLGLDWEPECLAFQNNQRAVTTPSRWQVRQPLYASAVGRWRRYEKHLAPMLATLAQDARA